MTLLQSAKPNKRTKQKERTILLYRSDFLDDLAIITGSEPKSWKGLQGTSVPVFLATVVSICILLYCFETTTVSRTLAKRINGCYAEDGM